MKAIIIDDEEGAQVVLKRLLERTGVALEVVATGHDLLSGIAAIKKHKPDVVFLDIQMPRYAGYEIVDFLEEIDFEIVFVTAFDHFAIKAFELSAIDYLLKPVELVRLKACLEKVEQRIHEKMSLDQLKDLKKTLVSGQLKNLSIRHKGDNHIVPLEDIVALQAQDSYTKIISKSGTEFLSSKHLKHYERLTEENSTFFRSHKSWIINTQFLSSFSKSKMNVLLNQQVEAKLSRHRMTDFKAHIQQQQ